MITERQNLILEKIVKDYINLAEPVSSKFLERKHNLGISPGTIRIEMQKLTDEGFLYQPHTSAGRIPTDRAYQFFVDKIIDESFEDFDKFFQKEFENIEKDIEDDFKFIQSLTKNLAQISSNLVLGYLSEKDFLWKEGWGEIFKEPEFKDSGYSLRFLKMIDGFEKELKKLNSENFKFPKIYIGKNPFSKERDFSIIISECHFLKNQKGILAILGPKRMAYQNNISLINSLAKILSE